MNYWTASHWLSFAVSAAVIAILAALLLDALLEMEERAEAMMVEVTLRNIRTGLMVAKGEAIIAGREAEIAGWAGCNPVVWLAGPPAGYEGACREAGSPAAGGWCFDAGTRELRYRPRSGNRLLNAEPGGSEVLRWQARAVGGIKNGLNVSRITD